MKPTTTTTTEIYPCPLDNFVFLQPFDNISVRGLQCTRCGRVENLCECESSPNLVLKSEDNLEYKKGYVVKGDDDDDKPKLQECTLRGRNNNKQQQ